MNKDMMNIDDFVRDKLGGHTEKEDPAAWLRMKALLDKEMPEKAAPFVFGWRKPAAFLGAALLIGALCVGGYKLSSVRQKASLANTGTTDSKTTATNQQASSSLHQQKDNTSPLTPSSSLNTENENRIIAEEATANSASANRSAATTNHTVTGSSGNPEHPSSGGKQNTGLANGVQKHRAGTHNRTHRYEAPANNDAAANSGSAAGTQASAGDNSEQQHLTSSKQKSKSALASNAKPARTHHSSSNVKASNAKGSDIHNTQKGSLAKRSLNNSEKEHQPNVLNSASSATSVKQKENSLATKNSKRTNQASVLRQQDTKQQHDVAQTNQPTQPKKPAVHENNGEELLDSISAISVVTRESTSRIGYPKKTTRVTDTIAITKIAVSIPPQPVNNTIISKVVPSKKDVKLAAAESKKANKLAKKSDAEGQKNVYAAATATNTKENVRKANVQSANASVVKVKKEKSAFAQWWENIPQAMEDAKRDFKSANFFFGVSAGANYSLDNGSGNFQGVQFGPTGELVFNKHWSLFGAIKYFNRSGSKKVVSDNYSRQVADQDSVQGANWFFTARTDSTNRYFNFSTVHSFEMPVTLRYTIRKFYLMTGINLAYYIPVNVEKVEREYNNMNVHVITTNATKPILNETKPQLAVSDFGSRFGMGYVIGAGYQINPAWQVDMRIVSPFWDNAKGAGAQKLSKDFYKLPSVQLSFGYQFNRIRNRATFGPNSLP